MPCAGAVETEHRVGKFIGFLACDLGANNTYTQAAQIFDQHHSQGNRDRPQFTHGQRLDALIRAHVAQQQVRLKPAVGMCDQSPRHTVDARESG